MQDRISKNLRLAVGRALAQAAKMSTNATLTDMVFLELIAGEESHATYILKKYVKDWELNHIKISIDKELAKRSRYANGSFDGETSVSDIKEGLVKTIINLGRESTDIVNSGHFLLWLLEDNSNASSKVLQLYGITAENISEYVALLPLREDYYDEMRALERASEVLELNHDHYASDITQANDTDERSKQGSEFLTLGVSLTQKAKEGKLDQVIGRDIEIDRLIQILLRRKKSNPVLIGEAGVGKSAVVEGLALKIANGDVPASLKGRDIFSLNIGSLVSGTRYRGDFEERITGLIDHLVQDNNTILFIDELHNIVGAGSSQGSMDAANLLKATLARGDIKCIGATTLDEYRTSIEKDGALERRFQKIMIEPMSAVQTLDILEKIKSEYEEHHNVEYSPCALAACVNLPERYLADRNFPDKAIDIMDETGAMARLQSSKESKVVVRTKHVEHVMALMTGVPIEQLEATEIKTLRDMGDKLTKNIVGQDAAVQRVVKAIRRGRTGLGDPNRPLGVFMFVGPTGVGKTHLAKELSKLMFNDDNALIRIDMSEYAEKHNMSRLIGSPPGYVGYGEGGQLTESVRRHPYSVVLFDEIEKAHPDLFNLMLQILDEGYITDGLGRKIDFRNTIIIMTSNVGSKAILRKPRAAGYLRAADQSVEKYVMESDYRGALEGMFAPEFINRIDDIVIFNALDSSHMARIVDIEISKLLSRIKTLGFALDVTPAAKRRLVDEGYEPRYGVRSLKRVILDKVEEPLADMIIDGRLRKGDAITVGVCGNKIELRRKVPA